jgi:uncharacterized protein DUF4233
VEGVTAPGADPGAAAGGQPARTGRARRQRSVVESLLSIALGLEAILVFFVTLTAFGLKALPPAPAFLGGAALILALIVAAALLRFEWGVWLGWVLQVALLATGFILPIMFFIGAGFVALYIFCFVKARQLTNQRPKETP